MLNLLKSDLKRMTKDKLFLIVIIVGAVLIIFTPLLQLAMQVVLKELDGNYQIYAKNILFASFNPGNNFGFILPIFMSIIIGKEFSHGTIRNKIISGISRPKIYLSLFLSSTIIICGLMLVQSLLTFFVSLLFFDYSSVAFTFSEFGYFLASLLFSLFIYVFVSSILVCFCVGFRRFALGLIYFLSMVFGLTFIGAITINLLTLDLNPVGKWFADFINYINILNLSTYYIGADVTYSVSEVIACIFTPLGFGALHFLWGYKVFNKADIK